MSIEWPVSYPALFTFLVGWHAGAVSLPPSDHNFAQLACPFMTLFTFGVSNLYLYEHQVSLASQGIYLSTFSIVIIQKEA
jgi:hypothetical protein